MQVFTCKKGTRSICFESFLCFGSSVSQLCIMNYEIVGDDAHIVPINPVLSGKKQ